MPYVVATGASYVARRRTQLGGHGATGLVRCSRPREGTQPLKKGSPLDRDDASMEGRGSRSVPPDTAHSPQRSGSSSTTPM
jgi:hypothetical protein